MIYSKKSGFTLIELLVVISIISLLSSIIFASLNITRGRAIDARKRLELRDTATALYIFFNQNGRMPGVPAVGELGGKQYIASTYAAEKKTIAAGENSGLKRIVNIFRPFYVQAQEVLGYSSLASTEGVISTSDICDGFGDNYYTQAMSELVSEGILPQIPKSPGGSPYCYYNYGSGNSVGALLITQLDNTAPSQTGIPPSCRPWVSQGGGNPYWCDQDLNTFYCLCNPF